MTEIEVLAAKLEGNQALQAERDRRYTERFDAQERANAIALAAVEKANQVALAAAEKAVLKAENAAERRFESQNEFRGTLSDQARTLMPRAEVEALVLGINDKLKRLDDSQIANAGKGAGIGAIVSYLFAVAGIAVAIAAVLFK